jgi:hypothetical protein
MAELRRVGVLTLLCCVLPLAANPAFSSGFEFSHETAYVHFTLPPTLGESVTIDWSVGGDGVEIWGLPGVADFTEVNVSGWAELGPLLSLDAEWNPDGSIGDADYVFGEGKFELELVFNLLDGTPHTMSIRGRTSPMTMSVCCGSVCPSGEFGMSIPDAKVDRVSAALFGMKRHISGDAPYYTDVVNLDDNYRDVALFGTVYLDYTPVRQSKKADLSAVPEPGILSLIGLGVAAAIRRRRA